MINNSLTELSNLYHTDKGDKYKCSHNYAIHYQKIFNDIFFKKPFSLLEIGLQRIDAETQFDHIPSFEVYKKFFGDKIFLYGFDIRSEFLKFNEDKCLITIGDQGSVEDLNKLCCHKYDIIIDDGSHQSSHQQISLRELWKTIKYGGYYVIEDLHWQPIEENCKKTVDIANEWIQNKFDTTELFDEEWLRKFKNTIDTIELFPSYSPYHDIYKRKEAFLVLKKTKEVLD